MRVLYVSVVYTLCALMVSVSAASAAAPAKPQEQVVVVADPWCPYTCGKDEGRDGYMIDMVRAVMAMNNIKVDYQIVPWTRAIEMTRSGKYHAVIGASEGDAPDFVFPKTTQGKNVNLAWVKKGLNWRYVSVESLKGKRLGLVQDYFYGDELAVYIDKNANNKKAVQFVGGDNALELNMKKLEAGRIDVLIENENVVQYHLAQHGHDHGEFVDAGNVVAEKGREKLEALYVAFSPKSPQSKRYAKILDEGIKKLRASGELKKILNSYGLEDWEDEIKKAQESK